LGRCGACLGALAPFADRALSGAGWEAPGSESGEARRAIESHFPGQGTYALSVVVAGALAKVERVLRGDPAVSGVLRSQKARRTTIVTGLAGAAPSEMVEAAGRLKDRLARLSKPGVTVRLTGPAAMWSDFNHANKAPMMMSEALSWPLTLTLLVLAFGTLIAAGLPLLLTMAGLLGAGGLLFVCGQLFDVSIWAMNFAMMFAIALGIDYALFVVIRFRGALAWGLSPRDATVHTMATAGKAVLASGLTVIAALLAVMLVPVPTFRSVPLGIVLAVVSVLAATLTLLPAALSALGHRVNGGRIRLRGAAEHRSERFAAWGRRLWARPLPYAAGALAILLLLAAPALGLRTGMPTIGVVPHGADSREGHALVERAFGEGAPSRLQVTLAEGDLARAVAVLERDRGIAAVTPPQRTGGRALVTAVPTAGEGSRELRSTIDRGVRPGPARVPGRGARGVAGLRVAGLRERVGADLLLRPRVRAGDGLHGLPAGDDQGGAPAHGRRPPGRRRGSGQDGSRDQRSRRGHGRGVHDVRARWADPAQGDGLHPRGRSAARRHAGPPAAAAGRVATARLACRAV
jgi:putative drug exporter of the RND superfamily